MCAIVLKHIKNWYLNFIFKPHMLPCKIWCYNIYSIVKREFPVMLLYCGVVEGYAGWSPCDVTAFVSFTLVAVYPSLF